MSETSIPIGVLTWVLINHCPGDLVWKGLHVPAIRIPWVVFTEIYRASAVCNTLVKANGVFPAGKYYPIPVIGPILVGTLGASAGQFLPLNEGLKAIEHQVPWNMQCGFITCIIMHFTLHDPNIIGQYMREYVTGDVDFQTCKFWAIAFFVVMGLMQYGFDPNFNPFGHVHRVLYGLTGVRPSDKKRQQLEYEETTLKKETAYVGKSLVEREPVQSAYEVARMVFVFFAAAHAIRQKIPGNGMYTGSALKVGESINYCSVLHSFRSCEPHLLTLEKTGVIAVYNAATVAETADLTPVWTSEAPKKRIKDPNTLSVEVTQHGRLLVKDGAAELWSSELRNAEVGRFTRLAIDHRGARVTQAAGGKVTWHVEYDQDYSAASA